MSTKGCCWRRLCCSLTNFMIFELITLLTAGIIFFVLLRRLPIITTGRGQDFWQPQPAAAPAGKGVDGLAASEDSVEEMLGKADQAFNSREYDTAERYYLKIAALRPDLPKVYNRLGIIYLERKNYKDARDAFLTTLKFDDQLASRHYNLGMAYLGLGNKRKAEAALKQALSLDAKNARYTQALDKLKEK